MIVTPITFDRVVDYWRHVDHFLVKAISHGQQEFDVYDVLAECIRGNWLLWTIRSEEELLQAAAVTQVVQYHKSRKVRIILLGGFGMKDWLGEFIEELDKYAKNMGCDQIEAFGRKGWVKASKHLGFKEAYTQVVKEVNNNG
ncbi:MAG: hypothetical protein GTN99_07015 [Candidatus Dadabacteria bacterium]|nr:hypothetical protein [Candidatus Dadabacteria bacterium]